MHTPFLFSGELLSAAKDNVNESDSVAVAKGDGWVLLCEGDLVMRKGGTLLSLDSLCLLAKERGVSRHDALRHATDYDHPSLMDVHISQVPVFQFYTGDQKLGSPTPVLPYPFQEPDVKSIPVEQA